MIDGAERTPLHAVIAALEAIDPKWRVDIGQPSGSGWIAGTDLRTAASGPFNDLLQRIGARAKTTDRRTIAASFALRFGWASVMAIAPFLKFRCVPDVALENVSFKFTASTFFERTAIHAPRGVVVVGDVRADRPMTTTVETPHDLLRLLRSALTAQAMPVVDALYAWSGFAPKGTWGMLTSSWAAQFTGLCETPDDQRTMLATLTTFFEGDDVVAAMQPGFHAVTLRDVTHLYQRRASCCRYYLLPQGDLCASCPLVSHDDRLARNLDWMHTLLERRRSKSGLDSPGARLHDWRQP